VHGCISEICRKPVLVMKCTESVIDESIMFCRVMTIVRDI
jgi:hypothetical protein